MQQYIFIYYLKILVCGSKFCAKHHIWGLTTRVILTGVSVPGRKVGYRLPGIDPNNTFPELLCHSEAKMNLEVPGTCTVE